MKVWIEADPLSPDDPFWVRVHAQEPTHYHRNRDIRGWCSERRSTFSRECRKQVEIVFGPLPAPGSRTLVEFDLRTGERTEWEPVR